MNALPATIPDRHLVEQARARFEFSTYGGRLRYGYQDLGLREPIGEVTREAWIDRFLLPILQKIKDQVRPGRNPEEIAAVVKEWAGPLAARGSGSSARCGGRSGRCL